MAHFKRGRAKQARAGCLMCKPHKHPRIKDTKAARTVQEVRADDREESFEAEAYEDDEG